MKRKALQLAALLALAATACDDVEWEAPEHFDDWITSNRYLEATGTAIGGMSATVAIVVAIFAVASAATFAGRRSDGPSVLDGAGSTWAFRTTAAVVAVTTLAWLVALLS